ncbi:MAG: hypothetical protein KatS3mg035_0372 [Bacteroidia bacterium]|nr:MAG: hypothetical protein KatS3mg035_0372 [Bacteroidia bacterium]
MEIFKKKFQNILRNKKKQYICYTMNSQNNQQILLYNFVSLLRGVCILGYISKNLNKSYHHNDFIQTSKNWVKEHLIECQAIQNHIDAILNIIDNEWELTARY